METVALLKIGNNSGKADLCPQMVLDLALSKIKSDGTVLFFEEEQGEKLAWSPNDSVDLSRISEADYSKLLQEAAHSIYGTMSHISLYPQDTEYWLGSLAVHLTAYRYDEEFLSKAVSLGHIDERGNVYVP